MSFRFVLFCIGVMVAGYIFTGRGPAPNQVSLTMPASTVIERLRYASRTVEGTGMGSLSLSGSAGQAADEVKVGIKRAGASTSIECSVKVASEDATKSITTIDCNQPHITNEHQRALGAQALTIVVREHVAATSLARDYDTDRVADQMIAFMARNAPTMAAYMRPPER